MRIKLSKKPRYWIHDPTGEIWESYKDEAGDEVLELTRNEYLLRKIMNPRYERLNELADEFHDNWRFGADSVMHEELRNLLIKVAHETLKAGVPILLDWLGGIKDE